MSPHELWNLKVMKPMWRRQRARLKIVEQFRDTCARCDGPKPLLVLMRIDVGAMFNFANMQEANGEAPRIVARLRRRRHVHCVTVKNGKMLFGHVGGHSLGNFRRKVATFKEMLTWLTDHYAPERGHLEALTKTFATRRVRTRTFRNVSTP